jgi:hypothetical protein
LIAYQRNIGSASEQDVLDEPAEQLVSEEQVDAGHETGDQDDGRTLDQLLLARPVDLLQLRPRLRDEARAAAAGNVSAVGLRGGSRRPRLLLLRGALLRRALDGGAALGLRSAAGAALGTGLPGH